MIGCSFEPIIHPRQSRYRWVMLAVVWLGYTSFGLVGAGIPPLVVYLMSDLGMTRSAMGSVLGAWQLTYIVFAVPAGALIDRFGLRNSIAVGLAVIALSGFLRALAGSYIGLFLAVALFGLGGPFLSIGAPKLISTWFGPGDRGTAMGIYLTAPSVGRILGLSTANSVLMPLYGFSWRLTLATFAGFAVLAGVVWAVFAREAAPPDRSRSGSGASGETGGSTVESSFHVFAHLLRSPVVRIVLVLSLGSFLFNHGLNNWLPEILRVGGMSAERAGFWATMPVVIGLVSILVVPKLAVPRWRIAVLVGLLLGGTASALMINTGIVSLRTAGLLLSGLAGRAMLPVLIMVLMDLPQVGPVRMGSAGGLFFTTGEVGGVLGPLLLGVISDVTGGFGASLLMLAMVTASLAVLALRLGVVVNRSRPG